MTKPQVRRGQGDLRVLGADANNLKLIDVTLPSPGVTLLTGASGSGKSSLLGDTLAVEGGRRREAYMNLKGEDGPAVSAWIGPMAPTVHFDQRSFRATSRTTVATATGLLTRVRRLFARHSRPWADPPGEEVPPASAKVWADWLAAHRRGPVTVWGIPVRFQTTDGVRAVRVLRDHGIEEIVVRSETDRPSVWEKGRNLSASRFKRLDRSIRHIIEARIGKVTITGSKDASRIHALLTRAFDAADGKVVVELPGESAPAVQGPFGPRLDTALHLLHPRCPTVFFLPSQHLLSFNAPEHPESGACPACRGTGRGTTVDESVLVAHPERSMHDGAFSLWTKKNYKYVNIQHETIHGLAGRDGFDPNKPWQSLPSSAKRLILDGSPDPVVDLDPKSRKKLSSPRQFEGFRQSILKRVARGSKSTAARLAELVHDGPCDDCGGSRWSPQARALRVHNIPLPVLLETYFDDLPVLLNDLPKRALQRDASALVDSIIQAARNLVSVGLGHLTGSRGMLDVSSGESRRLRLAGTLNAPVDTLLLLLDEPARGLHEEDIAGLANAIRQLSSSHTVVMNDHRRGLLAAVDHVIDMGTGAGPAGGRVHAAGSPRRNANLLRSHTLPSRAPSSSKAWLQVRDATIHNLSGVDVKLPLGRLTCITGLSGSGKSSFVRGALVPALLRRLPSNRVQVDDFDLRTGGHCTIGGSKGIRSLVALDQKTPPPNRRSLVLTFLDIAATTRTTFARTDEAKLLGLSAKDFGINAGVGRCGKCLGLGEVETEGGHAWTCPRCGGSRFAPTTLSVAVERTTIGDLLMSSFDDLLGEPPTFLLSHLPVLNAASDLGLGYITLGRRIDTLSGGEIQRLRIARTLAKGEGQGILFILDEPAAGLHPVDVARLGTAIERMLDDGHNTVILVEHNPALIAGADYVVEFGPGSGPRGGRVVATGTPRRIARTATPTGRVLKGRARKPKRLSRPRLARAIKPSVEDARSARDWIRLLLGDDVEPPALEGGRLGPGVVPDRTQDPHALWRVGRLDHELATFLLDLHRPDPEAATEILDAWGLEPSARLEICPYLDEIQTWGQDVPPCAREPVDAELKSLGMTVKSTGKNLRAPTTRAHGGILVPKDTNRADRESALREALAIGAGYAELVSSSGRLLGKLELRRLDLDKGLVGPMRSVPEHLVPASVVGACPTCAGTGGVLTFDESLVVRNKRVAPASDTWLRSEVMDVLRGVKRLELVPFLKRMSQEGLFDDKVAFGRLPKDARTWIMHGYWRRPGPGTFLKPRKPADEVGSWLRWDGLYRRLSGELGRSKNTKWLAKLEESRQTTTCPGCGGSGLGDAAELFKLGGKSLRALVRAGSVKELHDAIRRAPKVTAGRQARHEARRRRLLVCLKPALNPKNRQALSRPPQTAVSRAVLHAVVRAFTTMPLVDTR